MSDDKSMFDRLRARGEEVLGQVSGELMQNEHFMKAMQGALEGKQKLDQAVGRAMKTMNVPTRTEVKRAVARIEALEREVAALKGKLEGAQARPAAQRRRPRRHRPTKKRVGGMGRIAITGTSSFLGAALLRRLVERHGADEVVAVDIASPPATLHGVRRRLVDFTEPASDQRLSTRSARRRWRSSLHLAFFTSPRRDTTYAHELESIGTLQPAGGGRRGGGGARGDALLHRGLRGARPEPELPPRGPPAAAPTRRSPGCGTRWRRSSTRPPSRSATPS